VAPHQSLDVLSVWQAGQPFPTVSTLNSPAGATLANAAIVPAGSNGTISVLAAEATELIIEANGYFAPPNGHEVLFYPVTPCRLVDTRTGQGKAGAFGPPPLSAYANRDFSVAGNCNVSTAAQAYVLNVTAVPHGRLDFLSAWPAGQSYPGVSTLNSPDGSTIANQPCFARAHGAITVAAGNLTELIIDVNGYFAAPGSPGELHYYAVTPCRVVDTRTSQDKHGAFGPPSLAAYANRDFPIAAGGCQIPASARAYVLNMTVVPQGHLDFLSTWPAGQPYPTVSTLNSPKGIVIANLAIVPAGANGSITVAAGNPTELIIDINGYFAP
jgi:hypothetical protein